MGQIIFCDMCGLTLPIETALSLVKIGDKEIGKICINCSNHLQTTFSTQKARVEQNKKIGAAEYEKKIADAAKIAAHSAPAETSNPAEPPANL